MSDLISVDTNIFFAYFNPDDEAHSEARAFFQSNATNSLFVISEQTLVELYGLL